VRRNGALRGLVVMLGLVSSRVGGKFSIIRTLTPILRQKKTFSLAVVIHGFGMTRLKWLKVVVKLIDQLVVKVGLVAVDGVFAGSGRGDDRVGMIKVMHQVYSACGIYAITKHITPSQWACVACLLLGL